MQKKYSEPGPLICTIGHSTHPLDVFISMLKKNEVTHVLDVRTVPRSRKNPQFDKATLPESLHAAGIKYTHLPGLGGLRHAQKDSINGADMIQYAAIVAAWVGERDLALQNLAKAAQLPGFVTYGRLKLLPWYDPLRGDPRFEKIVASLAPR